jgi:hypothetical protein
MYARKLRALIQLGDVSWIRSIVALSVSHCVIVSAGQRKSSKNVWTSEEVSSHNIRMVDREASG